MTTLTEVQVSEFPVHYGTVKIDNLEVLYRDADRKTRRPFCSFMGFRHLRTCSVT
jgi:hypothetical protein